MGCALGLWPLLALLCLGAAQSCPDGWSSHQGSCYFMSDDTVPWLTAKSICETVGGFLVEIESQEENTFLVGMMRQQSVPYIWIGLEDFVKEGHFVWVRFQDIPEYSNWNANEPNDMNHHEDCGSLLQTGKWNDALCETSRYRYVCERSSGPDAPVG